MKMKKRQRTTWIKTHKFPNGFQRAGVVSNTKIGKPHDVIAYEEWWVDFNGVEHYALRHMSVDEALNNINCLSQAVSHYVEVKKNKQL